MINSKELREGNLIQRTGHVLSIVGIMSPIIKCISQGYTSDYLLSDHKLEGIPLTPEILERCGFACLDGDCDLSIDANIWLKYDKDASTVHLWVDDYPMQYYDYLHELQNVFYWLKKQELEIKELEHA